MPSTAVVRCFSNLKLPSESVQMCVLCEARCDKHLKGYGFDLQYMWHIVYPMNVVSFDMLAVFALPLVLGRVSLVAAIFLLFYHLHSFLSCFVPSFLPSILPPLLSSFIHLVLRHDLRVLQISAILMQSYSRCETESSELIKVMSMFDLHNHV